MKRNNIIGIDRIFKRNNIPWHFNEEFYDECRRMDREGQGYGNAWIRSGSGGINVFPSDITGPLRDDFLGICGLESGNNSLRAVFSAMKEWVNLHIYNGSRQPLTAVIITDKWNVNMYKEYCQGFEALDIRLVVILVADYPVQLPYAYTNIRIMNAVKTLCRNEDQVEAVKLAAWTMMQDSSIDSLSALKSADYGIWEILLDCFGRIDAEDVVYELYMCLNTRW